MKTIHLKRTISLLLAICMVFALAPWSFAASGEATGCRN